MNAFFLFIDAPYHFIMLFSSFLSKKEKILFNFTKQSNAFLFVQQIKTDVFLLFPIKSEKNTAVKVIIIIKVKKPFDFPLEI